MKMCCSKNCELVSLMRSYFELNRIVAVTANKTTSECHLHSPNTTASPIWDRWEWSTVVSPASGGSSLAFASTLLSAASTMQRDHPRWVVFGDDEMRQSIALLLIYVRNGNDRRKSANKTKLFQFLFFSLTLELIRLKCSLRKFIYYNGMKSDVVGTLTQHSFSGAVRELSRNEKWLEMLNPYLKKTNEMLSGWRSHVWAPIVVIKISAHVRLAVQILIRCSS